MVQIGYTIPIQEFCRYTIQTSPLQYISDNLLHSHVYVCFKTAASIIFTTYLYTGITFEDSNANIIYTFDQESGLLIQIESTLNNDTITLKYFGQQWPVRITHSNGKMLKITYTSSGLINYVDLVDEEENIIQTRLVHGLN